MCTQKIVITIEVIRVKLRGLTKSFAKRSFDEGNVLIFDGLYNPCVSFPGMSH